MRILNEFDYGVDPFEIRFRIIESDVRVNPGAALMEQIPVDHVPFLQFCPFQCPFEGGCEVSTLSEVIILVRFTEIELLWSQCTVAPVENDDKPLVAVDFPFLTFGTS